MIQKPQIAKAQTYFAIQTESKSVRQLADDGKRIFIRHEVTQQQKLFKAKSAGVTQFGKFNDAGYEVYGISSEIERKIKKGELLDRAGATELAQTYSVLRKLMKIKRDNIHETFTLHKFIT